MMIRGKLLILQFGALVAAAILAREPVTDDTVNWHDLSGWLRAASPETVVAEAGRLLLIALACWLALTTALAWFAFAAGCADAVSRLTPRFVRGLVEGAFAVTVVAGALAPSAASAVERPRFVPVAPVRDGRSFEEPTADAVGSAIVPDPAPAVDAAHTTSPAVTEGPSVAAPGSGVHPPRLHVVQRGESLWSIAHDHTAGRPAETYWRALCDVNRDTLPSGDVNLLHPGDVVVLPDPAA